MSKGVTPPPVIYMKDDFKEKEKEKDCIAFLFLSMGDHKQSQIWESFFANASSNAYNILIHAATRIDNSSFFSKYKTSKTIATKWGDISLVEAELLLMAEAFSNPSNTMFILLSDSCIPLYAFDTIAKEIKSISKTCMIYSHIDDQTRKDRYNAISGVLGMRFKEKIPFAKFLNASQWGMFDRDTVSFLLKECVEFIPCYKNVFAPDEQLFINLLLFQNKLNDIENREITYVCWDNKSTFGFKGHPVEYDMLSLDRIDIARENGCLFLRKINKNTNFHQLYLDTISRILIPKSINIISNSIVIDRAINSSDTRAKQIASITNSQYIDRKTAFHSLQNIQTPQNLILYIYVGEYLKNRVLLEIQSLSILNILQNSKIIVLPTAINVSKQISAALTELNRNVEIHVVDYFSYHYAYDKMTFKENVKMSKNLKHSSKYNRGNHLEMLL